MSSPSSFPRESHVQPATDGAERERQVGSPTDAERGLDAVLAVLQTLESWDVFEQGSKRLLRNLAGALGLPAGVLWLPREDELVARAVWTTPSAERVAVESALRSLRLPLGFGAPGRAWLCQEPIQQAISIADSRSRQQLQILRNELHASVAFPALAAEEVLAVLELYTASPIELTVRLRQVLVALGHHLGDFFRRRRGELEGSALTGREREVLTLAAEGLTVSEISKQLAISPSTVKTHLEHIYGRLGVSGRTSAVAYALRVGLIQ